MAHQHSNPVTTALDTYSQVKGIQRRQEKAEFLEEKREFAREDRRIANEKRQRLEEERELKKDLNRVQQKLVNPETGQIDIEGRTNEAISDPLIQDELVAKARESTGNPGIKSVRVARPGSQLVERRPELKGQVVAMATDENGNVEPVTDGEGDEAEVITVDERNIPTVVTGLAAEAGHPLAANVNKARQRKAKLEDQQDLVESQSQDLLEEPIPEEQIADPSSVQDPESVGKAVRLFPSLDDKVPGLRDSNQRPSGGTPPGSGEEALIASLDAEGFEAKVREAAQNRDISAEAIVNRANSSQQVATAKQALRDAGRLVPGELEATAPSAEGVASEQTSQETSEQIDADASSGNIPDNELTEDEVREEIDDTREELTALNQSEAELSPSPRSPNQISDEGRRRGKEAIAQKREQLQGRLDTLRGQLPKQAPNTPRGAVDGVTQSSQVSGETSQETEGDQSSGAQEQQFAFGQSPEDLEQQRAQLRKRQSQVRARAQEAKRFNQSARRNNEKINGIVEAVGEGTISGQKALELFNEMRKSDDVEIKGNREDGFVGVRVTDDGIELAGEIEGTGAAAAGPGEISSEELDRRQKQFDLQTDIVESQFPEAERANAVAGLQMLQNTGVVPPGGKYNAAVLNKARTMINADGQGFFSDDTVASVGPERFIPAVQAAQLGFESIEEYNDQVSDDLSNVASQFNVDTSRFNRRAANVAAHMVRGQDMSRSEALQTIKSEVTGQDRNAAVAAIVRGNAQDAAAAFANRRNGEQ